MAARLQELYAKELLPRLMKDLGVANPMAVPRITTVTVNMGVGEALADRKVLENAMADLAKITGQKPVPPLARKSVARSSVRDGVPFARKATPRRERMYELQERPINVATPRIRDFRGSSARRINGQRTYNLGVKEQIIFPEINYHQVDAIRGMDIAIT